MHNKQLVDTIIKLRRENKTLQEISTITGITRPGLATFLSKKKINKRDIVDEAIDKLKETELAYIAGIVDGEGSIIISKLKPNINKGEINFRYQLFCKVINTDKRMIDWLANKTQTKSYKDFRNKDSPNSRNTFSIHWPVNTTILLLDKIYPYLVIKKEQVDLAIKFRHSFDDIGHKLATDQIINFREQCYLKMQTLHRREFE